MRRSPEEVYKRLRMAQRTSARDGELHGSALESAADDPGPTVEPPQSDTGISFVDQITTSELSMITGTAMRPADSTAVAATASTAAIVSSEATCELSKSTSTVMVTEAEVAAAAVSSEASCELSKSTSTATVIETVAAAASSEKTSEEVSLYSYIVFDYIH